MSNIPRCEHPRPDRKRNDWINLNGTWDFEIDNSKVGVEKKYFLRDSLDMKITVPFTAESVLSGIGHTDFMNAVWYRRNIDIPAEWSGKRVILHIDACDYETQLYVNGVPYMGTHKGGYTSFQYDITDMLKSEGNYITLYVIDDIRSNKQAAGKQSQLLGSHDSCYTRTTGIWQTVWLEAVEPAYVKSYKIYANISAPAVAIDVLTSEAAVGGELTVEAFYEGKPMGSVTTTVNSLSTYVNIPLAEKHLWECGNGRLYDLTFSVTKNGKTVFGRFVLDQGFYPDGIITAPSDEALVFDIEASMKCGFNGARLHQKVFEPRFLYHADRLGYMVWAETGNWGLDHTQACNIYNFLPEWLEEIERDFSHPSVIGWCPTNETWDKYGRQQSNEFLDTVYDVTKVIDKTRPVITSSGSFPTKRTDVHDVHDYEQDPAKFNENYAHIAEGKVNDLLMRMYPKRQIAKTELPIFVSEYGGIGWVKDGSGWGYGKSVKDETEFFERLKGLTDALLDNPYIFAYCYTQLTDVEQEQNGLLTYQREFKFEPERYRAILAKKAAIED
ncbi:MAG: beta-galactosidase [Clostridia bacterium]|nr:beta-galactosidase [Clostridia bacterium]